MIANGDFRLRKGDDIYYKDFVVGDKDEAELDQAISEAITSASKHLQNWLKDLFRTMILIVKDVFRIRLSAHSPVDVPPMEIKFEKEERPFTVWQCTYSPEQLNKRVYWMQLDKLRQELK